MADKETPRPGLLRGWFKTILGTVTGLASGAAVMYITPLVDNAIKPAKPVANFIVEPPDGLNIRVKNLSNASQGYWDFGDGSPLLPVTAPDQIVTHTYPGPGDYTVKLSLQNVLNDTNDRSVPVKIVNSTTAPTPGTLQINNFKVEPLSAANLAPASFRISCDVQNAQICVWDTGNGKPLEVVQETPGAAHVRTALFRQPGKYTIKFSAVKFDANGGVTHQEKQEHIEVKAAPSGAGIASAVVNVTDTGKRLLRRTKPCPVIANFPQQQKEDLFKVVSQAQASPHGFTISDVRIPLANQREIRMGNNPAIAINPADLGFGSNVRNLQLSFNSERTAVTLSCDLVRDNKATPPSFYLPLEIIEQREVDAHPMEMVFTKTLGLPGAQGVPNEDVVDLPAVQAGWTAVNRQILVELNDGQNIALQPSQLPVNKIVVVQGRSVLFTATQLQNRISVRLGDASGLRLTGGP